MVAAFTSPASFALSSSSTRRLQSSLSPTSKTLFFSSNVASFYPLSSTAFPKLSPLKSSSKSTADLSPVDGASSSSDGTASPAESSRSIKSRLCNGETLYGLFLLSFSPTLAEIAGLAGYDFVVVDMEHGTGGISESLDCLRALAAARTAAILRLPESSAMWAKKALDLGPQGIMFPMIESSKDAKKAVSYCRYPPAGVRGAAHPVVRASKYGIDEGYLSNYEENLIIMCQVESEQGVKKIGEISAVDGVDCIQMGPIDLSASMGYLWDPGNKKAREMLMVAEKGVLASKSDGGGGGGGGGGAFLSGFAMPYDGPIDLLKRGYHMVSGAVDVGMFRSAAVEDVRRFKMALMDGSDEEDFDDHKNSDEKYWSE